MSIEDADTFFDTISRKVQALIEISSHAPSSLAIRLAELKRYLTDPVHRVRLHELVLEDVERVIAETGLDRFPLEGHFVEADLVTRLSLMEEATLPLVAILATLAFYADDARHDDLLVRAMERLSKRDIQHAGKTVMLAAQWYPALLSLYAIALGSLAASRPQPYVRALNLSVANPFGAPLSLAYQLAPLQVVARDAVARTPEFFRHKTPVSDLLHARLGPAVSSFVPSEATYDTCFDYAEYLHGIAVMDSGVGWAPFGRFIWRRARNEYNPPDAVLARYERELLEAGLCQGSKARLDEVHAQYASFLSTIPLF